MIKQIIGILDFVLYYELQINYRMTIKRQQFIIQLGNNSSLLQFVVWQFLKEKETLTNVLLQFQNCTK